MGCGVSTMDAEDATRSHPSNGPLHRHKVPRRVTAKMLPDKKGGVDCPAKQPRKNVSRQGKNVILVMKPILTYNEANGKQDCLDGKKIGEKSIEDQERVNEEDEEENNGRDNMIKRERQASLSFRDYCIDYDSDGTSRQIKCLTVDPSFKDYCNNVDPKESSKNEGKFYF